MAIYVPRYRNRALVGAVGAAAGYGGYNYAKDLSTLAYKGIRSMYNEERGGTRKSARSKTKAGGAAPLASGYSRKKFAENRRKLAKKYRPKSSRVLTKEVARLKSSVKQLRFSDQASNGTMTWRLWTAHGLLASENLQGVQSFDGFSIANMETALANLKYFDPANPGTLVTADFTTGTYQRQTHFKSMSTTLELRNNFISDCNIVVYLCKPKDDTDIQPHTAWSNGATDGANVDTTSVATYPSDFTQFKDIWTTKRVINATLSPGQSVSCSHTENDIMFDPSVIDSHNLGYQKEYKNFVFMVVIRGTPSHSSASSATRGLSAAGVDIIRKRTAVVNYDAGIGIEYVHADTSGLNTLTSAVQSHQPVPDNVSYSVS